MTIHHKFPDSATCDNKKIYPEHSDYSFENMIRLKKCNTNNFKRQIHHCFKHQGVYSQQTVHKTDVYGSAKQVNLSD